MNNPLVSIALTTYNHQSFIGACLDSILSQDVNFSFEIVIGEDLSTDNTLSIIKEYAKKHSNIRILERTNNLGYTRNFDDTMKHCKGDYISIFDGDDLMLPGKLQKQKDFLDSHPNYVIVGHPMDAFDSNSNKILRTIQPWSQRENYDLKDLIKRGSFFANSSKMFRKSSYPINGINPNIKYIADWAITLDIVSTGKIGFIWEKLALYRVHEVSIMQKLKGIDDFNDKKLIITSFLNRNKHIRKSWFKNQWAYAYMVKGIDLLTTNKRLKAFNCFTNSIFNNPIYSFSQYYYLAISVLPWIFLKRIISAKYFR